MKPETKLFSPHFVNYALRASGVMQKDIAASLDRSAATVCSVINGHARSQRVELRIAAATGLSLHELWPQWYAADGKAIKCRRPPMSAAIAVRRINAIKQAQREVA